MGSSEKAGNKGWPATPRDGAAVELQGLCFAVVQKLEELYQKKLYPYEGVSTGLCRNFDDFFNHL